MKIKFIAVCLLVAGCASKPTDPQKEGTTAAEKTSLTLLFSQQRKLNIEPCGCSLGQLGGLEREYNYLKKIRSTGVDPIYLVGSGGFVPEDGFKARDLKRYRSKAETITEALAKFRVGAIVPDQGDLVIGIKTAQQLSRKFGVPFVSSNLVDAKTQKPLFLDKISLPFGKSNLVILGISGKDTAINPEGKKALVVEPRTALQKALTGLNVNDTFVAVVHSLDQEEALDLMKEFPQVAFWLGGNRGVKPDEIFQYSKAAVSAEVRGFGHSILRFDLEPKLPVSELYHAELRRFQLDKLQLLNEKKQTLAKSPGSPVEAAESIERRVILLGQVTEKPQGTATTYKFERIDFGSDFAGANELQPILDRSRRTLSGENAKE